MKIENAIIKSVSISNERCLSAWIFVEGDGWGCGFGGYSLDTYDPKTEERIGTAYGTQFIMDILDTFEVQTWEGLVGKPVRCETNGLGGSISKIGHFTKNKWFDPKQLSEKMEVRGMMTYSYEKQIERLLAFVSEVQRQEECVCQYTGKLDSRCLWHQAQKLLNGEPVNFHHTRYVPKQTKAPCTPSPYDLRAIRRKAPYKKNNYPQYF